MKKINCLFNLTVAYGEVLKILEDKCSEIENRMLAASAFSQVKSVVEEIQNELDILNNHDYQTVGLKMQTDLIKKYAIKKNQVKNNGYVVDEDDYVMEKVYDSHGVVVAYDYLLPDDEETIKRFNKESKKLGKQVKAMSDDYNSKVDELKAKLSKTLIIKVPSNLGDLLLDAKDKLNQNQLEVLKQVINEPGI